MNEEQYAKVKGAALLFRAMGGELRVGGWGDFQMASEDGPTSERHRVLTLAALRTNRPPCICPMAALLLCEQTPNIRESVCSHVKNAASKICGRALGTRSSLVESFISGWDGSSPYKGHDLAPGELRAWYMAGRRMHDELVGRA